MRLGALVLLATGCTAIVAAPPERRVRCEVGEAGDPCPDGQRCAEGFCTPGEPCMEMETGCNGVDDDCDGETDEGSDIDGDGFSWCASNAALRDCRDDNPGIHPDGPDTPAPDDLPCDGADNDCDGISEMCPAGQVCDGASRCRVPDCSFSTPCPSGERCDLTTDPPRCVEFAEDCMMTGCTAPLVCDPVERECASPRELGEECAFDAQCGPDRVCVETQALEITPSHVGRADKVCTAPCCTHADCEGTALCWAPGNGARGCLPLPLLDMGAGSPPVQDLCASSWDCSNECVLAAAPAYQNTSRETYLCGAPVGTLTGTCDSSDECVSGVCVSYCDEFDIFCEGFCSTACGSTSDCFEGLERCSWVFTGETAAGVQGDIVPSCVIGDATGASGGASCTGDGDCRDNQCIVDELGGRYCADVCCSDDHCAAGHQCRPSPFGGRYWVMLCVRE